MPALDARLLPLLPCFELTIPAEDTTGIAAADDEDGCNNEDPDPDDDNEDGGGGGARDDCADGAGMATE